MNCAPADLMTLAECLVCLSSGQLGRIQIQKLCAWAGMPDCSPEALSLAASPLQSLSDGQLDAIKTYLLAVIAGESPTIANLSPKADCLLCLHKGQQLVIQTALLCEIAP